MILVTGATGQNGRALVELLSSRGVRVRALTRSAARAQSIASLPNVEVVEGDLAEPGSLSTALRDVERAMLISSSGPEMLDVQSNFISAAKAAKLKHVVKLSGIIPAANSPFRFARMHAEAEQRLEASGLAFTHLRAGEFMVSYFRQVPSIVAKGVLALPMADAKIASIDLGDIAEVAALTLTQPGHEGRIYRLTGPEALSMAEVAKKLSAVTKKEIRYVDVSPEDARRNRLAAGMPPYLVDALDELFAERRAGKEGQAFDDVEKLLGRKATTFDQFASRNAAIFRGEQPPPKVS
jgi:uncharacterized protein YbjT (DUF2867 family)